LSHRELRALVELTLFSATGAGELTLDERPDPCDLTTHRLVGLPPVLDQVQRFVRLSRHLGWAIDAHSPLDAILAAFGHRALVPGAIADVTRTIRFAKHHRTSVERLVALDAVGLAALLHLSVLEVELLAALTGVSLPGPAATLTILEHWEVIRASPFGVRELAYLLLGRDQSPAVFAPIDAQLDTLLAQLHALVHPQLASGGSDPDAAALLHENLARYFATTTDLVEGLLERALRSERDPALRAIHDLLAFVRATSPAAPNPLHADARGVLLRLDRAIRIARGFGIGARELVALGTARIDAAFTGVRSLVDAITPAPAKLAAWSTIARAVALRDRLPPADRDLFDLLADAGAGGASFARIEAATGWAAATAPGLVTALGLDPAALGDLALYTRLHAAHELIERYRIDIASLVVLGDPEDADALTGKLVEIATSRTAAVEDRRAMLTPINDTLREKRRDALLAHVVHHGASFHTAADVYAHYLIDVEMSSCQLTSRIVQAAAAVQLFVQRLRMNIEPGVRLPESSYWTQWEWRKSYRVWEAGRKVFVYPENWIEPDLRDDKSPLFRELENELQQGDLDDAVTERAYRGYLAKLDEVGKLDIRGLFHERTSNVLHVVARTRNEPHTYFYRRRLQSQVWTPWEKLDLNIEGDHLIPVVHEGRLMVFWAVFRESEAFWDLELYWSERHGDRWGPRKSPATVPALRLELRDLDPREGRAGGFLRRSFLFRTELDDTNGSFAIDLYSSTDVSRVSNAWSLVEERIPYSLARFAFDPCSQSLVLRGFTNAVRLLYHQAASRSHDMHFVGTGFALDAVEQVRDNEASDTVALAPSIDLLSPSPEPVLEWTDDYAAIDAAIDGLPGGRSNALRGTKVTLLRSGVLTRFTVLPVSHSRHVTADHPFVFEHDANAYVVTQRTIASSTERRGGRGLGLELVDPVIPELGLDLLSIERKYQFETFYHPFVCELVGAMNRGGVDALLDPPPTAPAIRSLDRQRLGELPDGDTLFKSYGPDEDHVLAPYPVEDIDFTTAGAYSLYNWELFFHIPLLVADRLARSQRFEEARRWFHYIFDPTDVSSHPDKARYWKVRPFYEAALDPPTTIVELLERLAAGEHELLAQIRAWEADPFNPHLIARFRTLAFMTTVVMKYLDNLIAWGDSLFEQDTLESVGEAAQLYVLAAEILGARPAAIERADTGRLDFATLRTRLDELANALVDLEGRLPATIPRGNGAAGPELTLYFCIPGNERLPAYRTKLEDRLFKIRHCMDLEGHTRQLALFAPAIDPALLVRARAAGLDLRDALRAIAEVPRPHHRYRLVQAKALELAGEVRALGNALLSTLDRRDTEELGLLRMRHELALLAKVRQVRQHQLKEAEETVQSLARARVLVEQRVEYYSTRERINEAERHQLEQLAAAREMEKAAEGFSIAASVAHIIPNFTIAATPSTTFGGSNIGSALDAVGRSFGFVAAERRHEATMTSQMAGYGRRKDDWSFQARQAVAEIAQIDRQLAAAEIRRAIAEQELANHDTQVDQSREVEDFLKRKFTSQELHGWMAGQLAALHFQAYRLAYDLARKAEKAAQFELGVPRAALTYIEPSNFESQRKGLLAGERLHHQLRQLDIAYLEASRRELEITKHVSLLQLDPRHLIELRETGRCRFELPEQLFDLDFPGHLARRIRSVSITIPCVTGPYTNVSAQLALESSQIRTAISEDYPTSGIEPSVVGTEAIATSSAQNDAGAFELGFGDDRYLPFEGAGALSRWRLELTAPRALRPFDYATISDVLVHLRYTARASDSPDAVSTVTDHVERTFGTGLRRLVSLRQEMSAELHQFFHPRPDAPNHEVRLAFTDRHFPFVVRERIRTGRLDELTVLIKPRVTISPADRAGIRFGATPEAATAVETRFEWHGVPAVTVTSPVAISPVGAWTIRLDPASLPAALRTGSRLNPDAIEDVFVVMTYAV
jgi:hypothetical protein